MAHGLAPTNIARAMLARLGVLLPTKGGFTLAPDYERFTDGLGFNFHTIALSSYEVFNVP